MSEAFLLAPPATRSVAGMIVGILLLLSLLLFLFAAWSMRGTRVEVGEEGISIRRNPYGRTLSWGELDAGSARRVDMSAESAYRPVLRTNGIGLPGYRAGWFRLPERRKALLFVTDPDRAVAIPVRKGYTLLLSVDDPDRFLDAVRAWGG